jgi:DNA-binding NarL/FixJ family response regulator
MGCGQWRDGVRGFSPAVARNLAASSTEIESDSSVASERLSLREEEVLRLLARGWSNDQIAQTLHISERTVRYHLGNIYGKLGVIGRGEAIAWAVRHGLADPE